MSLLVGIHLSTGQISWKDAADKTSRVTHKLLEKMEKGYVNDADLRKKLSEAKKQLGETAIARTIFVMPAFTKTKDRKDLISVAEEMGFGKCGIISAQAADCITSISKFNIHLKEKERMAVITKGKENQIVCYYWQKIGNNIKSYIKPYEAKNESQIEVLKENLNKYVKIIMLGASISPKQFLGIPYRVMKSIHNYWSAAALLKAGMIHWKMARSVYVPDFIEKNFEIRFKEKVLKKIERPCLPFKTNISLEYKKNECGQIEIFEGINKINSLTLNSKFEKSNIQFCLNDNAVINITLGPPLDHKKINIAEAKLKYALKKKRIAERFPQKESRTESESENDAFLDRQFEQWQNDADISDGESEGMPMFECLVCFVSYEIEEGCFSCSNWADGNPDKNHTICRECLENHAQTPLNNVKPLADGIHCVDADCKNVFILANIRNYLSFQTLERLLKQMQQGNLLLAFPKDELHECDICEHFGWIDKRRPTFICECGIIKCSSCRHLYNDEHKGKTCIEANQIRASKENSNRTLEERLSECVIRKCRNCNIQFEKSYGCNYMTCRCGKNMCYLCNAEITGVAHFCTCNASKSGKCSTCQKTCRQFEDHVAYDERRLQNIRLNQ